MHRYMETMEINHLYILLGKQNTNDTNLHFVEEFKASDVSHNSTEFISKVDNQMHVSYVTIQHKGALMSAAFFLTISSFIL